MGRYGLCGLMHVDKVHRILFQEEATQFKLFLKPVSQMKYRNDNHIRHAATGEFKYRDNIDILWLCSPIPPLDLY